MIIGMFGYVFSDEENKSKPFSPFAIHPFSGLPGNLRTIFSGPRLYWQLSAFAASGVIIGTGFDRTVHNYFVNQRTLDSISTPGVYSGYFLPAGLGAALWGSGLLGRSNDLCAAGSAVLQATILAVSYNSLLKALTGRPAPDPVPYSDSKASRYFRPGFFRGGIHYGWPSGHMMTNTAAVFSLLSYCNKSTVLKIAGGAYLGYLFASVISHEKQTMHWFSDAVTGTVLGAVIGLAVGKNFRKRKEAQFQLDRRGLDWSLGLGTISFSWRF